MGSLTEIGSAKDDTDSALVAKRRQVTEYLDNTQDERRDAELHRDYFDDKQWTSEEIAVLNARGQPVVTDNKIKDKVLYLVGVEQKTRTDPKAYPRTPVHDEDADVATDCIRYVFDQNRFSVLKSAVFQILLVEGFGGAEVIVDKDDPKKVMIRKVRWDRLYRDPFSLEPDCSDATYVGIITWMDESRAKERWKGKDDILGAHVATTDAKSGESTEDKPRWIDSKRKRVQIFEHYERKKGSIYRSVFCYGGFLEEEKECPYENEDGKKEWPLILASAYVDREGRRYGTVKRYISLQDEINKRKSKSMHLLNSNQIRMTQGAVEDVNLLKREAADPNGVMEYAPGAEFEIIRNLDLSQGHFMMLQQAEAALSVTGPNAALQGNSGSISGRAKELDQQGGAIAIGSEFDVIRDWQLRVARAVWNRIRQYWDEEMMIRVTDTENGIKFVKLNQPITEGEMAARELKQKIKKGEVAPEQAQEMLAQIAADPNAQAMTKANSVADLDVDIIIDEAPDVITLQAEEFEKLANLAGSGTVPIPPEVLLEASQLRPQIKKRVMDMLKGADDPAAQQRAQFQQMMEQMQGMLQEAQVKLTEAQAGKAIAETALTEAKTVSEQVGAVTKVAAATEPERLQ